MPICVGALRCGILAAIVIGCTYRRISAKNLNIALSPRASRGLEDYSQSKGLDISLNYKPINALSISLAPSFSHNKNKMQYINTGTVGDENRYIVGEIDQTTARLSLRMTYMITPNLSVQAWGQPFGTSGEYNNFKYITDANASDFNKRFTEIPDPNGSA